MTTYNVYVIDPGHRDYGVCIGEFSDWGDALKCMTDFVHAEQASAEIREIKV